MKSFKFLFAVLTTLVGARANASLPELEVNQQESPAAHEEIEAIVSALVDFGAVRIEDGKIIQTEDSTILDQLRSGGRLQEVASKESSICL